MSDKFSIDDILAEIGSDNDVSKKTAKSSGVADKKAPSQSAPGATMILNSIDEKKKTQGKENTIEISAENLQHLKGVVGEGQRRPKEPAIGYTWRLVRCDVLCSQSARDRIDR